VCHLDPYPFGALQGRAAVQSKREEREETEDVDGEEDKSKGLFCIYA
jgi:hypothetical protein